VSQRRKSKGTPSRDPDLRSAAEAQLARSRGRARELEAKPAREIIHDLEVHQIELEMQNEDLNRTHLALEESRDRYLDLYDFGPVGHFTFSRAGRIIEVNLTGATLLGVTRAKLIGRGLVTFVAAEDRNRWEGHLAGVSQSAGTLRGPGEKQGCEVKLQREDGSTFHVRLESIRLERPDSQESAGVGGEHPIIRTAMSDISERVRAERAAEEAHARTAAVLESITDAFFSLDREWRFTYVNREAERVLGLPRDQLVGHTIWEMFPQAVGSRFQQEYESAVGMQKTAHFEEFYPPFGAWFEVHAYPSASGLSVYFQDITGRRRAEEALERVSEQRRLALEAAGMGAWDYHFDTGEFFGDERCRNQWGLAERDRLDYAGTLAVIHPDDREATDEAVKRAFAGADGGRYHREFRVVWPDGTVHWIDSRGQVYFEGEGEQRRAVRFIGACQDISERLRDEERLRLLSTAVESAGDGIALADGQGKLLWVNPAFTELTGHSREEVVGQNPRFLKSGRQSAEFYRQMWHTIRAGQVWRGELVNRRKDGTLYTEEMTLTPVRVGGRQITHFIAFKQDITERKRMAEAQEFLLRSGNPISGESFFQALARHLAQSLGMDYVCIDRLVGDGLAAQTLAVYYDGKFEDNVSYALEDTPCGQVAGRTICCFPKDVRHLFPKDLVLQEMKAESYAGTTLWSFDGKPIGLIAVIGRTPLATPRLVESVLKLVAVRAAGELERTLAEAALRESEARLKMAQRAGGIGTFERNLRTGEVTWSEELEKLYGLPAGGFEGNYSAWQERVFAADRPAVQAHLAQAVAQRGSFQLEYRVVWPDGTIHWIAATGKVVTDEQGEPTRTLGVSMDITEHKRAEAALRESEARFRELFESSPDAVFVEDATGKVLDANPAAGRLHGLSREELIGRNVLDLIPSESREEVRSLFPRWFTDGLTACEGVSYRADGSTVPVDISGRTICYRGQNAVLLHVRDITERKRAQEHIRVLNAELEQRVATRTAELQQANEQLRREIEVRRQTEQELAKAELRYRTVADFTYDWEYWKHPDGRLLYCSPSCERVAGYTTSEMAVSPELLAQMVHPQDRAMWQQHDCEAMAVPGRRSVAFRIHRKDGELRWIEHSCQPVIGNQGEFLGVRASNRDVTERKQAEMEMQQLREELARVTRVSTAGQLTASLAHELNQPLTAIRCNAETAERLLASAPPNVAEARAALNDIANDSERASEVIQGLRALFRKTKDERSVLQINDIIRETSGLLRSEFVLKGITAELHLEPALPEVLGNRIELQQVVLNLLGNAIESISECEPGLRHLQLATGCTGAGEIRFSVRDCGPGIQVQPISRLFEPFFTTKNGGMGMGLAISQSICEAHGGTLGAANNPDRGATFQFTLPAHNGEHL